MALAWGIAASGVLQVLVVAIAAAKSKMRLSLRLPRLDADMRRLLVLAAPGVIAGGMTQLTVVLNTIIASLQDRVVSWLYYADRLFQLPLGVIGVAIGVVLLPELSHKLRAGDHAAVVDSENRSLEIALLLTLPAAIALFVAAQPIIRVLFERGAFTAIDAQATAAMLAALALGLPAFVLIKVFHPGFFAREDTKTPMIYAGIGMAANVMLALLLFVMLGAIGIAIATSIAGWLQVALLAATLRERDDFALDHTFKRRFPAILAASALMGAVVWVLAYGLGALVRANERPAGADRLASPPRRQRACRLRRHRGGPRGLRRQIAARAAGGPLSTEAERVVRPGAPFRLHCTRGDRWSCKAARAGACSICRAPTNARWRRPRPFPPTL